MGAKIFSMVISALIIFSLAAGDATAFAPGQGGGGNAPQMNAVSGKVVETMDSGGYTYVLIEKDGNKTWAACPQMKVAVGEDVALRPGIVMPSFTSKSLNRTFNNIIFSGGRAN